MMHAPTCPQCRSSDLLVVRLVPRDVPMRFSTCRHCEHRWWEDTSAGADLTLTTVLRDLAGVR